MPQCYTVCQESVCHLMALGGNPTPSDLRRSVERVDHKIDHEHSIAYLCAYLSIDILQRTVCRVRVSHEAAWRIIREEGVCSPCARLCRLTNIRSLAAKKIRTQSLEVSWVLPVAILSIVRLPRFRRVKVLALWYRDSIRLEQVWFIPQFALTCR